ncbi:hypothetical protein M9434_002497 [Picochlorum sp. BPE23]|nr:hypothetical protein M9434_002497 [Picochlorum sp. BPE23]
MVEQVESDPPSNTPTGIEDVQILSERGLGPPGWPEFPTSGCKAPSKQAKIAECEGIGSENQARAKKWEEELTRLKDSDVSSESCAKGKGNERNKRRRVSGRIAFQFPWANWQGELAYCNPCSLATGEMRVVNKTDNKTDLFRQHEKTAFHLKNVKKYKDDKFIPPNQRQVVEYTEKPAETIERRKVYQFAVILTQLRSYGSINGLKRFIDDLNATLVTDADCHLMRYASASNTTLWRMVDAMDQVLKNTLRNLIEQSDHIAFTIDASTDNSTTDYMDVEMRLWKDGKVVYLFLAMVKMCEGTKAYDQANLVLNAIKAFAGDCAVPLSAKVISVGADGCSTMQGNRNGVLKHLKDVFPYMLPTSCAAHKANLACEVIDKVPSFKYLCNLVKEVRNYFSNSPKRTASLQLAYKEVGLQFKKIEKIIDVRWMPVSDAFHSFCKGLPAILHYFDKTKKVDSEAARFFFELTDFTTLWEIFLYLPLLNRLKEIMKMLQKQNLFFKDLTHIINDTCSRIQKGYTSDLAFKGIFKVNFENLFDTHGPLFDTYSTGNPFIKSRDANGIYQCYFNSHLRKYQLHFNRLNKEEQKILDLDKAALN